MNFVSFKQELPSVIVNYWSKLDLDAMFLRMKSIICRRLVAST